MQDNQPLMAHINAVLETWKPSVIIPNNGIINFETNRYIFGGRQLNRFAHSLTKPGQRYHVWLLRWRGEMKMRVQIPPKGIMSRLRAFLLRPDAPVYITETWVKVP